MEEMMDDALDMNEDEEIEEEADGEVDKVLAELTDGKLGQAGAVGTGIPVCIPDCLHLPLLNLSQQSTQDKLDDEETERTMEQYRQQLSGLLSG